MQPSQHRPAVRPWRTLAWWLAGAIVLVAALWAGPGAWAATTGTCGAVEPGTVPTPCGVDDGAGAPHNTPVTIPVLANDLDLYNSGLSIRSVTDPANGAVVINRAAGVSDTVTYTPDTGFSGSDLFAYEVSTVLSGALLVGTAQVAVEVAQPGEPPPVVVPINPNVDNSAQFSQSVQSPSGGTANVTTTVDIPAGTFTFTLRPTDTLAIIFAPVFTPTGPVDQPPALAMRPAAGTPPYQYANLTFLLDVRINRQSIGLVSLNNLVTLTITYDPALLAGLDEESLAIYYWNGSAWVTDGLVLVERDPANNRVVFTLDRLVGEISFFARPEQMNLHVPLLLRSVPVYASDFAGGVTEKWTPPQLTTAPNGQRFLGEFGNQQARLALTGLPPHTAVSVAFDLHVLRSWDGNQVELPPDFDPYGAWVEPGAALSIGPDHFRVSAGDVQLMDVTFTNWKRFVQDYPTVNAPAQTGANSVNTLGYRYRSIPQDATYPILLSFPHTGPDLALNFSAAGLQTLADESWGLGQVTVTLH